MEKQEDKTLTVSAKQVKELYELFLANADKGENHIVSADCTGRSPVIMGYLSYLLEHLAGIFPGIIDVEEIRKRRRLWRTGKR